MFIVPVSLVNIKSDKTQKHGNLNTTSFNRTYLPNHVLNQHDKVDFTGLMPNQIKKGLKMCVYDLDETLLEGPQLIRDKVLAFSKKNNKVLVYSSARPIGKVQPLIDNGTLIMPDWCVCNNGVNIYKNNNGNLEEVTSWIQGLMKNFDKNKISEIMLNIAKKHMFTAEEWAKVPKEILPEGQKEFRGSKITEYESFGEKSNIRFMMVPGTYAKIEKEFEQKMAKAGLEINMTRQIYDKNELVPGFLEKYFSPEISKDIRGHHEPRMDKDGNVEVAVVTLQSDKGKATEYIRNSLGFKPEEVFASGDAENDFTHTNKNYFFALISNATEGLRKMVSQTPKTNIIEAPKPGVEGIYEVVRP